MKFFPRLVANLSGAPYALIFFYWLFVGGSAAPEALRPRQHQLSRSRSGAAACCSMGRVQGCATRVRRSSASVRYSSRTAGIWRARHYREPFGVCHRRYQHRWPWRLSHQSPSRRTTYFAYPHCCHPAMSVLADRLNLNNSKQVIDVLLRENKTRQRIQYIRRPHVQHHAQLELLLQLVVGHVDEEVVHRATEHHDRH